LQQEIRLNHESEFKRLKLLKVTMRSLYRFNNFNFLTFHQFDFTIRNCITALRF
jgi:hypothetical protein